MNSLLKYYGGKHYMRDTILANFPNHFDSYIEGFGGSASILFKKEPFGIEVYNDLDKNVYSVFKVLQDRSLFESFRDSLLKTPYSLDIWKEYKESLVTDELTLLERAIRFFYVNRSSFNSVGGFSVNLTIRRGMSKSCSDYLSSVDNLDSYNERISRVIIENRDIFDLIDKYDSESSFFYLDPPYVIETRKSSQKYRQEFLNEQHEALVNKVNSMKGKVLISGYNHSIYDNLNGFKKIEFSSPNSCSNATEVLWKNY